MADTRPSRIQAREALAAELDEEFSQPVPAAQPAKGAIDALTPQEIAMLGNMLSVMGDWGMFNLPQLHAIAGAVHRILIARAALAASSGKEN